MFEIDFGPILDAIIPIIVGVVGIVGSWALARLGKRFGVEIDETTRDYVKQAIDGGIQYAVRKVAPNVGPNGQIVATIEVRNEMLASAVGYVIAQVPDGLRQLKLTPENIANIVDRALPNAVEEWSAPTTAINASADGSNTVN
jgi:hypothetical protein